MLSGTRVSAVGPEAITLPPPSRTVRSAKRSMRERSCITARTTQSFSCAMVLSILMTSSWFFTSRADVGSSRRSILGSCTRARVRATFWRWPPLSSSSMASANSVTSM